MSIGSRIRALRARRNITQADLASRLGVKPQAVSQWERDETKPESERARELAAIFGVSMDWLLSDADDSVSGDSLPPGPEDANSAQFDPRILRAVLGAAFQAMGVSRGLADTTTEELLQIARVPADPSVTASPEDQARLRAATVIHLRVPR